MSGSPQPKVMITDVIMRARAVELPDACPKCSAKLHGKGAMSIRPLWATPRLAATTGSDDSKYVTGTSLRDSFPSEWLCAACGTSLVNGLISFTMKD